MSRAPDPSYSNTDIQITGHSGTSRTDQLMPNTPSALLNLWDWKRTRECNKMLVLSPMRVLASGESWVRGRSKVIRKLALLQPKLILWDIDGTLIDDNGAGSAAFSSTIKTILNLEEVVITETAGKTDPQIILELLTINRLPKCDITSDLMSMALDEYYKDYCRQLEQRVGRVLPGIREALQILDKSNNAVQGILTGNLRKVATVKLSKFGIGHFFRVGGFGSDSPKREEIGVKAIQQATDLFQKEFNPENIYIIGDTESDIRCGKALKVITVGVATGSTSMLQLKQQGADFVFRNFGDYECCLRKLELL